MCAPTCAAPEDVDMTCDDCVAGIKVCFVQILHFYGTELGFSFFYF